MVVDAPPTHRDIVAMVRHGLDVDAVEVVRATAGLANHVFKVRTADGRSVVVRASSQDRVDLIQGAVYWRTPLLSAGVPLPALLHHDTTCTRHPFPFMIEERLPGCDLEDVYPVMTREEKRVVAHEVARAQRAAASLPRGSGFGYAASYAAPHVHGTWLDFLNAELSRTRDNVQKAGVVDPQCVDRIQSELLRHAAYLQAVEPVLYLDDTTTRNVLVDGGKLGGIVDVDWVSFGDPLLPIALTWMGLVKLRMDTAYASFWLDAISPVGDWKAVFALYRALWCVSYLSMMGRTFPDGSKVPVDKGEIRRLLRVLDDLLHEAGE